MGTAASVNPNLQPHHPAVVCADMDLMPPTPDAWPAKAVWPGCANIQQENRDDDGSMSRAAAAWPTKTVWPGSANTKQKTSRQEPLPQKRPRPTQLNKQIALIHPHEAGLKTNASAEAIVREPPESSTNKETNADSGGVVVAIPLEAPQADCQNEKENGDDADNYQGGQDAAEAQQAPAQQAPAPPDEAVSALLAPINNLISLLKELAEDAANCVDVHHLNRRVANDAKKCALLKELRVRLTSTSSISETAHRLLAILHVPDTKYYQCRAHVFQILTGYSANWWKGHRDLIRQAYADGLELR